MGYDFRERTASQSRSQILELIVEKALNERTTVSLVRAFVDSLKEDWEEETDDVFDPLPHNFKAIGVIEKASEIERVMVDAFVARYRKRLDHPVTREEALDVFMYPLAGFPDEEVPREVAVAVAQAFADRDAREANAMRREVIRRGLPGS